MVSKLDLYILNNDNSVAPFPSEAEQIVLYDFTFEAQRMGSAPEITATIQANGFLENSLTTKVFCEYKGERYFLKNTPSSSKDNTDPRYTFDLTFVSERTILDNVYMIDAVQGDSNIDHYQSNSTNIMFTGTIEELVGRLNTSMTYAGVGYSVVLDEGITTESKLVSFQDKFFTEALQEGVKIFNIPYYFVGKVIHFGWSQNVIPTLKYGDGLLSINKSIRTERIVNRATATGSSENIPYYYPNPTPKGFIEIQNPNNLPIEVDSYLKLSTLPEGLFFAYMDVLGKVDIFSQFPNDTFTQSEIDGKVFEYGTTLRPYYDGGECYLVAGVRATSFEPTMQLSLRNIISLKNTNSSTIDEDSITIGRVYPCFNENGSLKQDDELLEINQGANSSLPFTSKSYVGNDGSLNFEIDITVDGFPSSEERYIVVEIINHSSNPYSMFFRYVNFQKGTPQGWYLANTSGVVGDVIKLSDYGIRYIGNKSPNMGDTLGIKVSRKIPFATTLMPPIYRESKGEQRFYNAINGAYEGIIFENEYSEENRKEAVTKFEGIKPTIVGVTNANGERIDMFAEFAYDLNDSDETERIDESSESFIHPYFYAKLRKIDGDNGFNLFAQAIESGEMTIEMTSGHCGACKFVIAVDKNTQRNLVMVDDNGDLIYDDITGKVKMANDATGLDRQNDTQNYEVWIALKKDINTFGTVMPMADSTIKPSVDDTFVITNILLPQAYFTAAEKKLEDEIIAFLAKNNAFQFEYDINFSRIFLKKRNDVFSLLTENACIPIEYNGKKLSFYVSSYTYRKQKGEVLPEISVSLTDSFNSTPTAFQQTINAVQESIIRGIKTVGLTLEDTDPRYLRKNVADAVKERTTFEKGLDFENSLTSKEFIKGDLAGTGFGVYKDEQGNYVVEADKMVIRKDAQFSEVVINQTTFQLGTTVFSSGGCNITEVEKVNGAYRCYYDNKLDTRYSSFVVGDQARCQRFDESQKAIIKYYWRIVVAVGNNYVDLSDSDVDGVGIPEVGDDIVQLGNRVDATRQSAIIIASTPTPTILQYVGVNSFTLPDPVTKISPNENEFTGKVHIGAGSTGVDNIEGLNDAIQEVVNQLDLDIDTDSLEFGKHNLLRNSGFRGDYLSAQLNGGNLLSDNSELFSPSLEHWSVVNAIAQESNVAESGAEVVITNGSMSQKLKNNIVVGDNYVLSFRAKGERLRFSVAGVSKTIILTDEYARYVEKFVATGTDNTFTIDNADCTLCELQLERGSVVSAWGYSMWDNHSELAYYQSLQYLSSALSQGSTTISGGLILTQMIMLGNYLNGVMKKNTAGVNGYYNDDSDVAFWAGGDIQKAIATVAKFQNDPRYQPTDAEWADMANFVATHGGDVFMRGYIYALGGLFRGAVSIANGKIQLNADGSGSLANGGYSWDSSGVAKKTYPDAIKWVKFLDIVDENNQISLDKGGYIGEVWSGDYQAKKTFYLPSDVNAGFSICLKAIEGGSKYNYPVIVQSEVPFRYIGITTLSDGGSTIQHITGANMYIETVLPYRPYQIMLRFNGDYWDVETDGEVGDSENTTRDISIWS